MSRLEIDLTMVKQVRMIGQMDIAIYIGNEYLV